MQITSTNITSWQERVEFNISVIFWLTNNYYLNVNLHYWFIYIKCKVTDYFFSIWDLNTTFKSARFSFITFDILYLIFAVCNISVSIFWLILSKDLLTCRLRGIAYLREIILYTCDQLSVIGSVVLDFLNGSTLTNTMSRRLSG